MSREQKWTKEEVEIYIRDMYKKHGNKLRSTFVTSAVRQAVINYWGGWREALRALNIGIDYKQLPYKKMPEMEGTFKLKTPDRPIESICWRCFRPISSEHYCPWHDHFELPQGVKYYTKDITYADARKEVAIIVFCPMFVAETAELRRKSRVVKMQGADKLYLLANHGSGLHKVVLE